MESLPIAEKDDEVKDGGEDGLIHHMAAAVQV